MFYTPFWSYQTLRKASKFGEVVVALAKDSDIKKYKKFTSPLTLNKEKEILNSIKNMSQKLLKQITLLQKNF